MPRGPDFLIVGAAKSGTTSLSAYLGAHPDVIVVSNRLEFFGEFENPAMEKLTLAQYLSRFETFGRDVVTGEKSVSYLYSLKAPAGIQRVCPDAKILMLLRNPVDRAYSDYWHRRRTGVETMEFEEALDAEPTRIRSGARFELHYVNYGRYSSGVERYMRRFGRERVKVLITEEFREDPLRACRECFEFLGVASDFRPPEFEIHNRGGKSGSGGVLKVLQWMARTRRIRQLVRRTVPNRLRSAVTGWMQDASVVERYPPMSDEVRERLKGTFGADIDRLEELLGRRLQVWR